MFDIENFLNSELDLDADFPMDLDFEDEPCSAAPTVSVWMNRDEVIFGLPDDDFGDMGLLADVDPYADPADCVEFDTAF